MNIDAAQTTLAADIGGTHMRAALISEDGGIPLRRVLPTPRHAKVPSAPTSLIRSVAAHETTGKPAPSQAVVGLPGPVDYRAGKLLRAPHLPRTRPGQLSEHQLASAVGLPVRLAKTPTWPP